MDPIDSCRMPLNRILAAQGHPAPRRAGLDRVWELRFDVYALPVTLFAVIETSTWTTDEVRSWAPWPSISTWAPAPRETRRSTSRSTSTSTSRWALGAGGVDSGCAWAAGDACDRVHGLRDSSSAVATGTRRSSVGGAEPARRVARAHAAGSAFVLGLTAAGCCAHVIARRDASARCVSLDSERLPL